VGAASRGQAADGEVRVVGVQGAGADEHGVGLGAQPVDVGARGGRADPAAGGVGGGDAPVEGGGVLPQDVRAAQAYGGEPGGVALGGLRGEESLRDLDARGAQGGGAAAGLGSGVGDGVVHAGDARLDEGLGAGTGASGVVAGFEGDVGGAAAGPVAGRAQGVDLGVRAAGPLVVALARDRAVGGGDHAADDGVRAGGAEGAGREHDGSPHGVCIGVFGHRVLLPHRARTPGPVGIRQKSGTHGGTPKPEGQAPTAGKRR
jgi:hypothetical protein